MALRVSELSCCVGVINGAVMARIIFGNDDPPGNHLEITCSVCSHQENSCSWAPHLCSLCKKRKREQTLYKDCILPCIYSCMLNLLCKILPFSCLKASVSFSSTLQKSFRLSNKLKVQVLVLALQSLLLKPLLFCCAGKALALTV